MASGRGLTLSAAQSLNATGLFVHCGPSCNGLRAAKGLGHGKQVISGTEKSKAVLPKPTGMEKRTNGGNSMPG
jgi:hypothetical protein